MYNNDKILLEQAYHAIYENDSPFKPATPDDIEDRKRQILRIANQKVQEYIKNGSVGNLILMGTSIQSLPRDLKVGGRLNLSFTSIKSLPPGLEVGGNLDLSYTSIQSLPADLKVGGKLKLPWHLSLGNIQKMRSEKCVQELMERYMYSNDKILLEQAYYSIYEDNNPFQPASEDDIKDRKQQQLRLANQKVQDYIKAGSVGDLDLYNTPIQSLPDNLKVGGDLRLDMTPIQSLPDNLKVGGSLDLYSTPIQSLPPGLEVGGNLYLVGSPIQSLPDNLQVGGRLGLGGTPIQSLPAGLKVGGNLNLTNTQIQSLPDDLKVGRSLYIYNTPLSKKHTKQQIKQMCPGVKGSIDA